MRNINNTIRSLPPVFWFLLVLSIIIVVWKFRPPPSSPPIKISENAVSNGIDDDDILIHKTPYFNDEECVLNWDDKEEKNYEAFLEKCPKDIESKIYLNNDKARQKANNSDSFIITNIAIVVPISRKKIGNNLDRFVKVNGLRVFDSIELLQGIELAQREINETLEGIRLGEKRVLLEITIVDDSYEDNISEKERAERVANYLVEDVEDIIAVVGHFSSDSIQAAADIYQEHKLVAISPTSTAVRKNNNWWQSLLDNSELDDSEKLQLNSYIFRTSPNDEIAIARLIGVIKGEEENNEMTKKVMILYEPNSFYSSLYRQLFVKQVEEEIDNSNIIDDNRCEFYEVFGSRQIEDCIEAIEEKKPDFFLLAPSSANALETANEVLEGAKNLESKPQLLGSDSMFDPDILSEKAEGMIVVVPTETELNFKGIQLNWRGAMTYDAAFVLAEGIENSGCNVDSNSNLSRCLRQNMRKVLSRKDFEANGVLGINTVYFTNGDRVVDESLASELEVPLIVKKNEKGEYRFERY